MPQSQTNPLYHEGETQITDSHTTERTYHPVNIIGPPAKRHSNVADWGRVGSCPFLNKMIVKLERILILQNKGSTPPPPDPPHTHRAEAIAINQQLNYRIQTAAEATVCVVGWGGVGGLSTFVLPAKSSR